MNKEVIKAMNKKKNFSDWWNKNSYKIIRVVLFPIWWGICLKEKIDKYLNSKCVWNEDRADKILSYYIPRQAEWDNEDKYFYLADNGMGWLSKDRTKYIKFIDRRWWKCNCHPWGGNVRKYLIEQFKLEDFEKKIGDIEDGWTEIYFNKK